MIFFLLDIVPKDVYYTIYSLFCIIYFARHSKDRIFYALVIAVNIIINSFG